MTVLEVNDLARPAPATPAARRLSDIQPQFFPRLHYIARMLDSDVFVIRDDVQFVRNHKYPNGERGVSYQAHSPIKAANGEVQITVSTKKGGDLAICDTALAYEQNWVAKALNVLRNSYAKAPCFKAVFPEIEALLKSKPVMLGTLNVASTAWALIRLLEGAAADPAECTLERANALLAERGEIRLGKVLLGQDVVSRSENDGITATQRIVQLCKDLGADEYMAGGTAFEAYMETERFTEAGLGMVIQDWRGRPYEQRFEKAGFIGNLSVIDLLMNVSPDEALDILLARTA